MKKRAWFHSIIIILVLAGCTGKPSPNLCASVCEGLVAYYPFLGDATDKSGNGNDGKVVGASLTKDRNGYQNHAYRFDGQNSRIDITSGSINDIGLESRSFTVSVILKVEKTSTDWIRYSGGKFSKGAILIGHYGNKPTFKLMYHYYPNGSNNLWFNTRNHQGKTSDALSGQTKPLQYNHFVGVANHEDHSIILYANGKLIDKKNWNGTPNHSSKWSVGIMGNPNWEKKHRGNVDGIIDEVRVYNRALSADEVKELYLFTSAFPPAE